MIENNSTKKLITYIFYGLMICFFMINNIQAQQNYYDLPTIAEKIRRTKAGKISSANRTQRSVDFSYHSKNRWSFPNEKDTFPQITSAKEKNPFVAVKTNLLYDAASALNVELEFPAGKQWSIAGEYIFPWRLQENDQYCFQLQSVTLESRYWLGNRAKRPVLTGWFFGIYIGGGYYDFERDSKGMQGEFFTTGLSGGFAHTLDKNGNFSLEYLLGAGYFSTRYRKYDPRFWLDHEWHLIRSQSGVFGWFGPTRAKMSLIWTPGGRSAGEKIIM